LRTAGVPETASWNHGIMEPPFVKKKVPMPQTALDFKGKSRLFFNIVRMFMEFTMVELKV
jgi:hypothetical protein